MRRPPGMSHTDAAMDRIVPKQLIEITQLPHRAADFDSTTVKYCYSSGIIAAILKASKSLDENRSRFTMTNIANNTAHKLNLVKELSVTSSQLPIRGGNISPSLSSLITDN